MEEPWVCFILASSQLVADTLSEFCGRAQSSIHTTTEDLPRSGVPCMWQNAVKL